jgi:hypothetical protein
MFELTFFEWYLVGMSIEILHTMYHVRTKAGVVELRDMTNSNGRLLVSLLMIILFILYPVLWAYKIFKLTFNIK